MTNLRNTENGEMNREVEAHIRVFSRKIINKSGRKNKPILEFYILVFCFKKERSNLDEYEK
jgi:hypothetical protein